MYEATGKDTEIFSKLGKGEQQKQRVYILHHRRKVTEPPDGHGVNLPQI
jgi:hypothetical protein